MALDINSEKLVKVKAHFGRPTSQYNPSTRQFILRKHNGIHLIDPSIIQEKLQDARGRLHEVLADGGKVLFVGTNPNTRDLVKTAADFAAMPFVIGRWPGGLLTNFSSIRQSIRSLCEIEERLIDYNIWQKNKRAAHKLALERNQRLKYLDGIRSMTEIPQALFVVDAAMHSLSVKEAQRLGIEVFALCSSNANIKKIDNVIPGSVDSPMAVRMILECIVNENLHEPSRHLLKRSFIPFAYIQSDISMSNAGKVNQVYSMKVSVDIQDSDVSIAVFPSNQIKILSCERDTQNLYWEIFFQPIRRGKAYIEIDFLRSLCRVLTLTARFRIK